MLYFPLVFVFNFSLNNSVYRELCLSTKVGFYISLLLHRREKWVIVKPSEFINAFLKRLLGPHCRNRKASQSLALSKAGPTTPLLRLRVKVTGKFKGASCFSSVQRQAEKYHSVKSSHLSKNITDIH